MAKKIISQKVNKVVKLYSERLTKKENLPIDKVIVFGSQVKGGTRKWSDIDVCIISPKFKDPIKAISFLLQKRNTKEVMAGLEPVGFTKQDFEEGGSFIQEIKKTGVAIT